MSIIAYDGKMIAADRQGTAQGMRMTMTKLIRLPDNNEIAAFTGSQSVGLTLIDWYVKGRDKDKWPKIQETDDFTDLIITNADGCFFYQKQPEIIKVEDKFMAWGCGRDYAMAAMGMGASAKEAIEVACRFDVYCGHGVDCFEL